MINIESLHFAYPQDGFSLQIPTFSVPPGQKLAIIGFRQDHSAQLLIAGIYPPDARHIRVASTPVHRLSDAGRRDFRITRIGFVFQNFELPDYHQAVQQAQAIAAALIRKLPEHQSDFERIFSALREDLMALDLAL